MEAIARKNLPKEFGGILTGIREEGYWIVTDFEVPDCFKQSSNSFTRYVDHLNRYLKEIYFETNGKVEYLGEWHTHPFGTSINSNQDFKSMMEIANDEKVKTKNPLLIIFSIKKKTSGYTVYQYHENELTTLKINN